MKADILIVDDDRFLTESLKKLLEGRGFTVRCGFSLADGWCRVEERAPDLLILDLSLPDGDGVSLCRQLRNRHRFPILMLTSRSEVADKVVGLEIGADDYITKPFEAQELISRIHAHLRRKEYGSTDASRPQSYGALSINEDTRRVSVGEQRLSLTATEYTLLQHLTANAGRAVSREQLFAAAWGAEADYNQNSLDVLMYRLRKKLAEAGEPRLIRTIRGHGFKFGD